MERRVGEGGKGGAAIASTPSPMELIAECLRVSLPWPMIYIPMRLDCHPPLPVSSPSLQGQRLLTLARCTLSGTGSVGSPVQTDLWDSVRRVFGLALWRPSGRGCLPRLGLSSMGPPVSIFQVQKLTTLPCLASSKPGDAHGVIGCAASPISTTLPAGGGSGNSACQNTLAAGACLSALHSWYGMPTGDLQPCLSDPQAR